MGLLSHLVLFACCYLSSVHAKHDRVHWIWLFYHKTGTVFSENIISRFAEYCTLEEGLDRTGPGLNMSEHYQNNPTFMEADLIGAAPQALIGHWDALFANPGHRYRIIHFIRDPFSLILSAYAYHSQMPPPERWISTNRLYCPKGDFLYAELLGGFIGNVSLVQAWEHRIAENCQEFLRVFQEKATYGHLLQHLSNGSEAPLTINAAAHTHYLRTIHPYKHDAQYGTDLYLAIRMEAFRSLHELLNEVMTKLHESSDLAMTMTMEEFGVGNKTQFRVAAKRMMTFLMDVKPKQKCPMCKCMDMDTAVELALEVAFIDPTAPPDDKRKRQGGRRLDHVTTGLMPSATRNMYIARLRNDTTFGPLLKLLSYIISQPTPQDGSRLIDKGLPQGMLETFV